MKNKMLLTMSIMLVSAPAFSQTTIEAEIANESPRAQVIVPQTSQPITRVEASPLSESKADRLRRIRQEAELNTERKIVEKLETSRMKDEQKRAEELFGDRLNGDAHRQQAVEVAPQVMTVEPAQDNEALKQEIADDVTNSIKSDLEAARKAAEKKSAGKDRYFMSAMIGSTEYPDAQSIQSNSALGFSLGVELPSNTIIEGRFAVSNFYVDDQFFYYKDMDQYELSAAAKYVFIKGRIKPMVGALVSYVYRKYDDVSSYGYNYSDVVYNTNKTDAFDAGFTAGVDLEVSKTFSIGMDYRYMTNITSRVDRKIPLNDAWRTPVEDIDYYSFNIIGKISF